MTTGYPLACSYIHVIKKINVIHSIQDLNLHIYYFTAQKPRGKKPLWGWEKGVLSEEGDEEVVEERYSQP